MRNGSKARVLAIVLTSCLLTGVVAIAQGQGAKVEGPTVLSARDVVLGFETVGGATLSPDNSWVLYTHGTRDMEHEQFQRVGHIWRVRVDGTDRRQLTHGEKSASSPAWFPDGSRIAFASSRSDGSSQVYAMYTDGGEAWQVTKHEDGMRGFQVSPDGTKILFTALDPLSDDEKRKEKERDDTIVVDEKFRWTHIWVHDLDSAEESRVTEGNFTVSDPRWSPDSSSIAYVSQPTTKLDDRWNSDIWVVDVASGERRKLYENGGTDSSPRWSPDGSKIAFASKPQPSDNTWHSKLYVVPVEGGEPRILLEEFDRDFGGLIWAPDAAMVYWSTGDRATMNLFSVDLSSGEVSVMEPPVGFNRDWELAKDGSRWVWGHTGKDGPGQIYTAATDLSSAMPLTDTNRWLREGGYEIAEIETITWTNSDGQMIEGVLTKPVGYQEGVRYPLVLNPHGGPSGAVLVGFNPTNQLLAGNGFLVLQPNFRGSSNYGQQFLNANRNYWGIRDYDDCMTGVDHLVNLGMADPDRLIAYGWSYGGYMTFWISTQTDRFKLISPGAGLSNLYSMYSTTDIGNYLGWFFGTPWDNEEVYLRLSPIRHAKNVTSRMLIMHGANDARVPPEQAIEFHRALRDLDKDSTLVIYPREGHGIGEPRHAMDRLRRYVFEFSKAVDATPISERAWEEEQAKMKEEAEEKKAEEGGE